MKLTLAAAVAVLALPIAAAAQDIPSMVGTWKGQFEGVGLKEGWKTGTATIVVTEQRGRAFRGYTTYPVAGKEERSDVVGTLAFDSNAVTLADNDGIVRGAMLDPNTLQTCYIEAGEDALVSCARLTRQR